METRKLFLYLNGGAIVLVPVSIFFLRIAFGTVGWFLVMLILGGFLAFAAPYLVLFIISAVLPRGRLKIHRWLVGLWWTATSTLVFGTAVLPDAGDGPDSGMYFGLLDSLPAERAERISMTIVEVCAGITLVTLLAWIVLCVVARVSSGRASGGRASDVPVVDAP